MDASLVVALGILAHLVGDYILQSNWMSVEKTSRLWPAIVHGVVYTLPFILITQSVPALLVIAGTHIVIDRYRLAKYLVWAKNRISPVSTWSANPWTNPDSTDDPATGYPKSMPAWMSVWLMILADNTAHIVINTLALLFL